jgi:hypothetical protein
MTHDLRQGPESEAHGHAVSPKVSAPALPSADDPPEAGVDLSSESVAGEEDPGAALDLLWPAPPA